MSEVAIGVLQATGVNCDAETATAVRMANAQAEMVHFNNLASGERRLDDYQGLIIPGGFSHGDTIRAGVVLGLDLQTEVGDQLSTFVDAGKPVMGICNGFQVLVNSGLLPAGQVGASQEVSLATNANGRFNNVWVNLRARPSRFPILPPDAMAEIITLPVANREGQFVARDDDQLQGLFESGQVVLQYAGDDGSPTLDTLGNPSGAQGAIAGICSEAGNVVGLMPHPERFMRKNQHYAHTRPENRSMPPYGLWIMRQFVDYARQAA